MNDLIEKFQNLYNAIFSESQKLAVPRQVAKHMARVWIYELEGVDALHPEMASRIKELVKIMEEKGKPIKVFETVRSFNRQNKLYAQGRTTPGNIVTYGKPLEGYHSFGLAADIIFRDYAWNPPSQKWWNELGEEGKKLGLVWGGDWETLQDYPHFQLEVCSWQVLKQYFER